MKKLLYVLIVLMVLLTLSFAGQTSEKKECDDKEVKAVQVAIKEFFVKGFYHDRDVEVVKKGFHPNFTMLALREDNVEAIPLSKMIEKLEKWKQKEPEIKNKKEFKLSMLDVVGNAAVARLDAFSEGKCDFTDYLSLYKFNDGWKIVGITFNFKPEPKKEK
jgi:hypothetical protein